jgi:hypothetical protein
MVNGDTPLIEPLSMNYLEEVVQLCAGKLAGLPDKLDPVWLQPPVTLPKAIIQTALQSFIDAPPTESGPATSGWVALDRSTRRVRAVLGARFIHFKPDEVGYTYMPPAYSIAPWWICQAESLQAAAECFPALFAAWQAASVKQKSSRLQVPLFAGQWSEGQSGDGWGSGRTTL